MNKSAFPIKSFSTQEQQRLVLPSFIASVGLLIVFTILGLRFFQTGDNSDLFLLIIGVGGIIYAMVLFFYILARPERIEKARWGITIIAGAGMGLLFNCVPNSWYGAYFFLGIVSVIIASMILGRAATYIMLGINFTFIVVQFRSVDAFFKNIGTLILYFSVAIVIVESILYLIKSSRERINRLQIINSFARNVTTSLEIPQVINLLNAALQNSINADTYFFGILDQDNQLNIDLLYDDGEYFPSQTFPIEGTLSGWAIQNDQTLFLPDLRDEPSLDGIKKSIVGQDKSNLSWMGVPIHTANMKGIIAVGSYSPNAFDGMDLELLENLAQQSTMALDNAYHHSDVEQQSRMDSLTGAYNHGYFLKVLGDCAQESSLTRSPLSLIMLDVDYFKAYNDTYGHVYGDEVLCMLTKAIKSHIKRTDAVGRWGGEEFSIVLPNTNAQQALKVARRVQQTMAGLMLTHPEKGQVPVPTVSQGIALFPAETRDIFNLIDMADKRLYIAKKRGRNQVEPDESSWEKTRPLSDLTFKK